MRNTRNESVAEHSFITALIAHALCAIDNEFFGGELDPERAAALALYHEAAEVFTGDLPTPVKYHSEEIRKAYKTLEKKAEQKFVDFLPERLKNTYASLVSQSTAEPECKYVKFADKIAALIKCNEELANGNLEFKAAKESTEKSLKTANDKAVNYFLENFVSSFGLSLDETL